MRLLQTGVVCPYKVFTAEPELFCLLVILHPCEQKSRANLVTFSVTGNNRHHALNPVNLEGIHDGGVYQWSGKYMYAEPAHTLQREVFVLVYPWVLQLHTSFGVIHLAPQVVQGLLNRNHTKPGLSVQLTKHTSIPITLTVTSHVEHEQIAHTSGMGEEMKVNESLHSSDSIKKYWTG